MTSLSYLPIEVDNIKKQPFKFAIDLQNKTLIFEVSYNEQGSFFSFNLFDKEENPILYSRRVVYGVDMLENIVDDRVPEIRIIPVDKTGNAESIGITLDNFMSSVKPYIVGGS